MENYLNFTCICNSSTTWYKYESFDISLYEIHVIFEITSGKTISSIGEPYWVRKTLNRLSAELGLIENKGVDYKPKWVLTEKGKKIMALIPEDKYLVLGDNREISADSRVIGLIDKDDIQGKTSFRLWPLNKIGNI